MRKQYRSRYLVSDDRVSSLCKLCCCTVIICHLISEQMMVCRYIVSQRRLHCSTSATMHQLRNGSLNKKTRTTNIARRCQLFSYLSIITQCNSDLISYTSIQLKQTVESLKQTQIPKASVATLPWRPQVPQVQTYKNLTKNHMICVEYEEKTNCKRGQTA